MPVFALTSEPVFPPPSMAREDGLLAVGGDLSVARLCAAYAQGIFPWFNEGDPVLWWSPDPRLVLRPRSFHASRSLARSAKRSGVRVTGNRSFDAVMRACAETGDRGGGGTWITQDMFEAYTALHRSGLAHSIETWRDGELIGGLYGVAIGRAFFGESMFARETDASKIALWGLCARLAEQGVELIDCQMTTGHLLRMGAAEITRNAFLRELSEAADSEDVVGLGLDVAGAELVDLWRELVQT